MIRRGKLLSLAVLLFTISVSFAAQKKSDPAADKKETEKREAARKEVEKKEKQTKEDKARAERAAKERANNALRRWLDEVDPIITPAEEKAFKKLSTDEEREQFIEQFWLRRDPSTESAENEYRDEYYTRIAYANDHYTAGIPGWKTDRGRIYVMYGRPDELETHPMGGSYVRDAEEGGGQTTTHPFERWRYRRIDGIGQNVRLEFVDDCLCGEYRLTPDPSAKDAEKNVPGAGLFLGETADGPSRLAICKAQGRALLGNCTGVTYNTSEFDRLQLVTDIMRPPAIKYADLTPSVTTKILTNLLPFELRADFIKVTDSTVHTPVTLQFALKDLAFRERDGVQSATVRIHGEVRDVGGRLTRVFEDTARSDIASASFNEEVEKPTVYQANLYLNPGRLYSLYVAIEDVNGGNIGTMKQRLSIPSFPEEGLAMSSLILADKLEPLPPRSISPDIRFVLGDHYVRPNVKGEFRQDQMLKIWAQTYGLKVDEKAKPSATVEIQVLRDGAEVGPKIVADAKEFSGAAQQVTVVKDVPLADLAPGQYTVHLKITDNMTKDTVTSTEKFTVKARR